MSGGRPGRAVPTHAFSPPDKPLVHGLEAQEGASSRSWQQARHIRQERAQHTSEVAGRAAPRLDVLARQEDVGSDGAGGAQQPAPPLALQFALLLGPGFGVSVGQDKRRSETMGHNKSGRSAADGGSVVCRPACPCPNAHTAAAENHAATFTKVQLLAGVPGGPSHSPSNATIQPHSS